MHWFKIADKLPELDKDVLLFSEKEGYFQIGSLSEIVTREDASGKRVSLNWSFNGDDFGITHSHWSELAPPKIEEK